MKHRAKSLTITLSTIFACVVGLSQGAYATQPADTGPPSPEVIPCSVDDVKITAAKILIDGAEPTVVNISASSCLAVTNSVNNFFNHSFATPSNNLGYDNDGWLNQGPLNDWWTGPGAFIDEADLLDLDGVGGLNDPGWIRVGKDDGEGGGYVGQTSYNDDFSYTFNSDLITITDGENVGIGSKSGEWVYSPPKNNPQDLLDLMGGDFFDQVAVVFKAGNGFAIYNFNIVDLVNDIPGIGPVLAGDFNWEFSGTWNIENTLGASLSNMSFWARDPIANSVEVPEPSSIVIFLLSGVLLFSRKKVKL